MTPDFVTHVTRETLITVLYIATPLLGTTLLVGLAVGIFQAVTSIQEMTLTFIPKMAVVAIMLIILTPWFLDVLVRFTQEIIYQIPFMSP
jgi:flagellar biosynthetic protein FliQ|tara:strand:- start:367 stop:636 length:270 start_codon:yes stop_codon:yes gene_type:complete